jgi:hypothetical protein
VSLDLRIDLADVERTAARLTAFSQVRLREAAARAANKTADRAMPTLRKQIGARVALPAAFIDRRTTSQPASAAKSVQEAVLIAPARRASAAALGLENPLVSLRNYGPQQIVQGVKYPNASIAQLIGKWGRNPTKPGAYLKWKARRGDAARGIAVDDKADGVSVHVLRSSRKRIATAFLAPARAGKRGIQAGGMAVFQRQANGTLKLLHGPAVYRLFRDAAVQALPALRTDLRAATTAEVEALIDGVFT